MINDMMNRYGKRDDAACGIPYDTGGGNDMEREMIIVLDFGGQYNQLIDRRVRECNVYCEVKPYTMPLGELKAMKPKGIIFTGGPNSVYDEASPHYDPAILDLGIPILGIC